MYLKGVNKLCFKLGSALRAITRWLLLVEICLTTGKIIFMHLAGLVLNKIDIMKIVFFLIGYLKCKLKTWI